MADAAFRQEQRRVAARMAAAALLTVAVVAAALHLGPASSPRPLAERLAAALRVDLLVVLPLAAAIGNVARLRFLSAQDIAGSSAGAASPGVRHAAAVLPNTLEQAVLAAPVHLALASLLPAPEPVVAALAGLFLLGRVLFWAGYAGGAATRAFGFALTFYPTLAGLLIACAVLVAGWTA